MQTNSEKPGLPISVGVTTMIVVLFICTLTMIAVFGMRSVFNRNIGVMKEIDNTKAYYEANAVAYEKLEYISSILAKEKEIEPVIKQLIDNKSLLPNIEVEDMDGSNINVNYMVNICNDQYIKVKLKLGNKDIDEKNDGEDMLQILEWRIINE